MVSFSLDLFAFSVCICVAVWMRVCSHAYMNTFVYMVGAHAHLHACPVYLLVLNCCGKPPSNLCEETITRLSKPELGVGGGLWKSKRGGGSSQSLHPGRVIPGCVYGSNINTVIQQVRWDNTTNRPNRWHTLSQSLFWHLHCWSCNTYCVKCSDCVCVCILYCSKMHRHICTDAL